MKILLFSHLIDIDGLGSVVLSKLAYEDVTYELCVGKDVNKKIEKYQQDKKIYAYDKIFITDLCPSKEVIEKIEKDNQLKGKIFIFDHHISYQELDGIYDWVKVKVEDEKGKCCGTSLFYKYLLEENKIKETKSIQQFVENTRQYDTWEWKTRYNNQMAEDINILFDALEQEGYIKIMYEKLKQNQDKLEITEKEKEQIEGNRNKIKQYVNHKIDTMIMKKIEGYTAGVIFSEKYNNFIAEVLREKKVPIEYAIFINLADSIIQYRSMGKVETWKIAVKHGGKGNQFSGGNRISKDKIDKIIEILYPKEG